MLNIRDQQKTIPSLWRSSATICVEHFLNRLISIHVSCFARSFEDLQYTLVDFYLVIVDCLDSCKGNNWDTSAERMKSENNVVAWIKAHVKISQWKDCKSAKYSKIKFMLNSVLLYVTAICVKHFLNHLFSNHVRCFARSVEDLQYTLTDSYLVIVDCLDSCLPSLPGNLLKASAWRRRGLQGRAPRRARAPRPPGLRRGATAPRDNKSSWTWWTRWTVCSCTSFRMEFRWFLLHFVSDWLHLFASEQEMFGHGTRIDQGYP